MEKMRLELLQEDEDIEALQNGSKSSPDVSDADSGSITPNENPEVNESEPTINEQYEHLVNQFGDAILSDEEEAPCKPSKKSKKNKKKAKALDPAVEVDEDSIDVLDNLEKVEEELQEKEKSGPSQKKKRRAKNKTVATSVEEAESRAPKNVTKASKLDKKESKEKEESSGNVESSTTCSYCNTKCGSRNALFQHLKSTGHAIIKPTAGGSKKKRK